MDTLPGTPEDDRLEVNISLVEAYETAHFPIPEPNDPVEELENYMISRGLSRADLIPYPGSKERVSEVPNRKRGLSLSMIRMLHTGLGIPTVVLVGKPKRIVIHRHAVPVDGHAGARPAAG